MRPLGLTMAILALLLTPSPSARADAALCGVSKAQFAALQIGMTYREAVKVLGCDGEEILRSVSRGLSTATYSWGGTRAASLDANMYATFRNDKLVDKAQIGLRD